MSRSAMRTALAVAALALAVLGSAAQASITIDQLYSNFDGTIQFIVLGRSGDPLPSLAGRALVVTDGVTSKRYTFPAGVSADRNHPRVLVATQGVADLGKVAADYIVPTRFLPLANGSVSLDDAVLDYTGRQLPTDGWHALYRDAFSGSSEVFVAAATNSHAALYAFTRDPTLTGLWWNPAQPGWGLAVEEQAGALFTLWATHDANGSPTWFYAIFAPVTLPCDDEFECDGPTVTGAWSGTLYSTTGPPSSAGSYDASRVVSTPTGTITLQQLPPVATGDGSFDFAIGDTSGHRTFTRAAFGDPVRQCFLTPAVVPGPPNHEGLWWNPSEPGWALQLNHQGDVIFAIWFTYDDAGRATWLSFTASPTASGYAGTLYRTTGAPFAATPEPAATTNTAVGTASLAFADASHGTFAVERNGSMRTRVIEREQLAGAPPICD
ncbi:MAG: hypothetical protein ACM3NZ_03710 [Betaproteobacteria bacterium]